MKMNKLGGGMISGWVEAIIFSLIFLAAGTVITVNFNGLYGQSNVLPFQDDSGSEALFITYQNSSQTQLEGSEVDFNSQQGVSVKSSWGITKDVIKIIWKFISGGWIEQIIGAWNLGEAAVALAKGLRIIWFLSLVFAVLYALFKTVI